MGTEILSGKSSSGSASRQECLIRQWLEEFAAAVRAADYEAGERLFADHVVGFGTRNDRLVGLKPLVERQWKQVWGITSGFCFNLDQMSSGKCAALAWVAVPWASQGRDRNGDSIMRRGRATFVLEQQHGRWVAVHSHLSMNPSGPANA